MDDWSLQIPELLMVIYVHLQHELWRIWYRHKQNKINRFHMNYIFQFIFMLIANQRDTKICCK